MLELGDMGHLRRCRQSRRLRVEDRVANYATYYYCSHMLGESCA
jgi:hypothetical protein